MLAGLLVCQWVVRLVEKKVYLLVALMASWKVETRVVLRGAKRAE